MVSFTRVVAVWRGLICRLGMHPETLSIPGAWGRCVTCERKLRPPTLGGIILRNQIITVLVVALLGGLVISLVSCAPLIEGTQVAYPPSDSGPWQQTSCFKSKPQYGQACCMYEAPPRWLVVCTRDGDEWFVSEEGVDEPEEQTL